jgi:hypothetical protein
MFLICIYKMSLEYNDKNVHGVFQFNKGKQHYLGSCIRLQCSSGSEGDEVVETFESGKAVEGDCPGCRPVSEVLPLTRLKPGCVHPFCCLMELEFEFKSVAFFEADLSGALLSSKLET